MSGDTKPAWWGASRPPRVSASFRMAAKSYAATARHPGHTTQQVATPPSPPQLNTRAFPTGRKVPLGLQGWVGSGGCAASLLLQGALGRAAEVSHRRVVAGREADQSSHRTNLSPPQDVGAKTNTEAVGSKGGLKGGGWMETRAWKQPTRALWQPNGFVTADGLNRFVPRASVARVGKLAG